MTWDLKSKKISLTDLTSHLCVLALTLQMDLHFLAFTKQLLTSAAQNAANSEPLTVFHVF